MTEHPTVPDALPTWTDHLRYHREEPCDCEPPADALEELTRLVRENGLNISVSKGTVR